MEGRKAIPISQHRLTGTFRKDRHEQAAALELDPGLPECPDWLSERAKAAWTYIGPILQRRNIASKGDRIAIEALCVDYAEWRDLQSEAEREGFTYRTTTPAGDQMIRPNPKIAMRDAAWRRLQTDMTNFGLHPGVRSRVSPITVPSDAHDPWADL